MAEGFSAAALTALALAGCATLGNPPAAENNDPAYTTAQPNLASLSEVIEKHPSDPQAYNMRGAVFGDAGRNDEAAGLVREFNQMAERVADLIDAQRRLIGDISHEIKSPLILQPGPAALTDGLAALQAIVDNTIARSPGRV